MSRPQILQRLLPASTAFSVAVIFISGCGVSPPLQPDLKEASEPQAQLIVEARATGGLVHILRLSPREPATGDTLQIHSVVVNRGAAPVHVEHRMCDVDVRADLHLNDPFPRCFAYSGGKTLTTGDSLSQVSRGIVRSGPGTFSLSVRHLLNPEHWTTVQLKVQKR